jgi:hypothetical protein
MNEFILVFHDFSEDGHPLVAFHDADENFLFDVKIPSSFVEEYELEIGDEFRVFPVKASV